MGGEMYDGEIYGIVLQPDGKPTAENARVIMATHDVFHTQILNNDVPNPQGTFYRTSDTPLVVSTDEEGRFKFPLIAFDKTHEDICCARPEQPLVNFILFIRHDTGFKRLPQQEWQALDRNKTITLEPWGRIEGTVNVGTQPGKNVQVECSVLFQDGHFHNSNEPMVHMHYEATADESGKFSFDRVAPSFARVARTMTYHNHGVHNHDAQSFLALDRIELKPGEMATVTLGGVGRPVVGKLVLPEELDHWWTYARLECSEPLENTDFHGAINAQQELWQKMVPKEILEQLGEQPSELYQTWRETEDGKKFIAAIDAHNKVFEDLAVAQERNMARQEKALRSAIAPDGTFRLDDVSEGDRQLTVTIHHFPEGRYEHIGMLEHKFTVAAIPGGVSDEPLDLGTLEIKKPAQEHSPIASVE